MKRLTERLFRGPGHYMLCSKFCDCEELEDAVNRLGQIEDILGDEYDLERLRELVDARQGGMTVADRIRAMSDEELAHEFANLETQTIKKTAKDIFKVDCDDIMDGNFEKMKRLWLDGLRQREKV